MNNSTPHPPPQEDEERGTRAFGAPLPQATYSQQPYSQPPPQPPPYGQPPQAQPPVDQTQAYGQPPYPNQQPYGQAPYQQPYQQQPGQVPYQQSSYGQAPAYGQAPYGQSAVQPQNYNPLRGVGGWLLFFCISLTILSPLVTLFRLLSSIGPVLQVSDRYPGLLVVTIIDTLLSIGLMGFSIFAGISLWRVAPKAVAIAKAYLISLLVYSILVIPLMLLAGLPSRANGIMLQEGIIGLLRSFGYIAIWFSYLNKSKRVAATFYGDDGGEYTSLNLNR